MPPTDKRDSDTTRIREFDRRHGSNGVVDGDWIRYSNGAVRKASSNRELIEPPNDPSERIQLQIRYRELLLRSVRDEFHILRDRLNQLVNAAQKAGRSPPSYDELLKLLELKAAVKARQQDVIDLRIALDELNEGRRKQHHHEANAKELAACQSFLHALQQITV
jgi:hypothetical protein